MKYNRHKNGGNQNSQHSKLAMKTVTIKMASQCSTLAIVAVRIANPDSAYKNGQSNTMAVALLPKSRANMYVKYALNVKCAHVNSSQVLNVFGGRKWLRNLPKAKLRERRLTSTLLCRLIKSMIYRSYKKHESHYSPIVCAVLPLDNWN